MLQILLMHEAAFKCNESSTSLSSKLFLLLPFWLVLETFGV